jgi:hypothetical protein
MTYRAPGLKHGHPAISSGPFLHPIAFARGTITKALDLCLVLKNPGMPPYLCCSKYYLSLIPNL